MAGATLENLKRLTSLQILGLSHTKVTDAGAEHLKGLELLRGLMLNGPGITDAGLPHLKRLTRSRDGVRFERGGQAWSAIWRRRR